MASYVELGKKVRDEVTGFVGVVTGRAEYLYSDTQCLVESKDTTGRPIGQWIDESRLKLCEDISWEE